MMDTKAMGVGQVFVFIIAAITFSLIMIFGYKALTDFMHQGEKVQFFQFKTDIERSIKEIYTEYGAVRVQEFRTPAKTSQVCFVDFDAAYDPDLCQKDVLACTLWETSPGFLKVDQNIFLTPPAEIKIKGGAKIKMEKGFLCLPVQEGTFKITLEGKGDHTYLSSSE